MEIKLQTKVPIHGGEPKIDYHSRIVLLGSCFSETIGEKLQYFKFNAWSNPFGVIFNPYSLQKLVQRVVLDAPFKDSDLFEFEGLWKSFEVHSQWSRSEQEVLLNELNAQRQKFRDSIYGASHCIITLGTAWVYRHKGTDTWVANCHKVPGTEFTKELMEVEEIVESLGRMVADLQKANPNTKVIFTISPVRHVKDGFVENNRSKGRLIDAVQTVVETTTADYFPSFEIMMDELRDYRFYGDDLLHPSSLGVEYIWSRFQEAWIDQKFQHLLMEVDSIQKALQHRPQNPDSNSYQEFAKKLQKRITSISERFPHMRF